MFQNNFNILQKTHSFVQFFLVFFIFSLNVYGITDTTQTKKQQYDLNDPRNPDCPCHKYQKMADEEFVRKNLQKDTGYSDKESQINNGTDGKNMEDQIQDSEKNVQKNIKAVDNSVDHFATVKFPMQKNLLRKHQHKKNRLITKIRFRLYRISKKVWKIKTHPNYCVCFKWH